MTAPAPSPGLAPGQASFAVGGSALLFPYYLGLLYTLQNTGYVKPGKTRFAGISGGALSTGLSCGGYPANYTFQLFMEAMAQHPKDIWVVREAVIRQIGQDLPPDAFKKCSGKVHIAMSMLNTTSGSLYNSTSYIVGRFRSNDDYLGAMVASSTLACAGYTADEPECAGPSYYVYRRKAFMDGAYANTLDDLCNSMGLKFGAPNSTCVGVYTYEPGVFRKYPGQGGTFERFYNGTCPARAVRPKGRGGWNLPTDCSAIIQSGQSPDFTPTFNTSGIWPAIFPGCDPRNPINFTLEEWQEMALDGKAATPHMQQLFEYGKRDGELWVLNQTTASRR